MFFSAFMMISLAFGAELSERLAEERFEKNLQKNTQQEKQIFVDFEPDSFVPFKERRQDWGASFALSYTNLQPKKQKSKIDAEPYASTIDKNISVIGLSVGILYNFSLAALSGQVFFETGQEKSERSGVNRKLELKTVGTKLGLYFNNLFSEPYVVPYILGKVFLVDWAESKADDKKTGQNAYAVGSQIGALIQLNWLESDKGLNAQKYGLENTYLDLYVHQNNTSNSTSDPDLETDFDYGLGLLLEF